MQDIDALVRLATRRLMVARFLETLLLALVVGLCVLLVWALLSRTTPLLAGPWWIPTLVVGSLAIASAVFIGFGSGRDRIAVAVALDTRLGLQDRFSTALQLADRDDPFAVAAVADAARVAADPAIRGRVAHAFRPVAPRGWWVTSVLLVALVGVWTVVPQGDLFAAEDGDRVAARQARADAKAEVRQIVEMIEPGSDGELAPEIQEALAELADGDFTPSDGDESVTPEDVRREAIRRVGDVEQRMQELLESDEARMQESLRDSLSGLEADGLEDADAKDLSEALKEGDFSRAQDAFERMSERLKSEGMSDADLDQLESELEALADALESLAQEKDALAEALREAGLDEDLARDPEALEQAMKNASMTESQRQAIEQMMKSQSAASDAMKDLAEAMQQMAQQCEQGQQGQQSQQSQQSQQQGQQANETLSQLEQIQQKLQQAKSTQQQCQNACDRMGSGLSQWAANLDGQGQGSGQEGQGPGMRGPGQGRGGEAQLAPTPSRSVDQREQVKNLGGDIIAREMIDGEVVVGESRAALQRIADRIARGDEEGVGEDPVPPHLRDVHRHYFGEVEKRIRAVTKGDDAPTKQESDAGGKTEPVGSE